MYVIGQVTDDGIFEIHSKKSGKSCIKLELKHFFGSSPKTTLKDTSISANYPKINYKEDSVHDYLKSIFQLESVGC